VPSHHSHAANAADSLIYLPLAEATVITFLAPLLAAWICSILIKTPFTRIHKIAGFVSIGGVVLIAQPFHFFNIASSETSPTPESLTLLSRASSQTDDSSTTNVTPAQHASAVAVGLLGVCGAACAYTTISWIGKRAHPLISVNYFATWCTIVSTVVLLFYPGQTLRLPVDWREWLLIVFLGGSGFVMQFLLTSALSHDRNRGKGLNMVYTQMLFALVMDKLVWGHSPGALSIVGSSMILGSAVWVAVMKEKEGKGNLQGGGTEERGGPERREEEVGLVEETDADESEERGREEGSGEGRFAVGEEENTDEDIEMKDMDEGMDDNDTRRTTRE
jgi:drug/metabolite transporter (DMT)-like permease